MGKLIFHHGVMEAGKTSLLIQKAYLFEQKGKNVLVIKPSLDTRSSTGSIESRIGLSWPCVDLGPEDSIRSPQWTQPDIILVDEAQFLQPAQVEELAHLADDLDILVIAFGLKNNFQGTLFAGSKRLIELADRVDESPSMCQCGKKATMHLRVGGSTQNEISCGGSEKYLSVCRGCYFRGIANETEESTINP